MGRTQGNKVWKIPQGGIEEGQTPGQAAISELKQETDIDVSPENLEAAQDLYHYDYPADDLRYIPGFRGQKFKWFMVRVRDTLTSLDNDEDLEFDRLAWFTPQEVLCFAHNERTGDVVT